MPLHDRRPPVGALFEITDLRSGDTEEAVVSSRRGQYFDVGSHRLHVLDHFIKAGPPFPAEMRQWAKDDFVFRLTDP